MMNMLKELFKFIISILIISYLSYNVYANNEKVKEIHTERDIIEDIEYIQDKRTGLCFAVILEQTTSLSNVPCDKVKDRIVELSYIN